MSDPLAEMIALLQPSARHSKQVNASGVWRVQRSEVGQAFYCMVLAGQCKLDVDGPDSIDLGDGDFVLIPAAYDFAMSSRTPPAPDGLQTQPVLQPDATVRLGQAADEPDVRLLIGYCHFGAPDAELLISLLPDFFVVRKERRLENLAKLVRDEALSERPARDVVLDHLLQVLLIETVRSAGETSDGKGLVKGLSDPKIARALRQIHDAPQTAWTVADLARAAGMSRSAFFTKFNRKLGLAPMEYILNWRITLAKSMLRQRQYSIAEIAEKIGYGSTSAFSVAFSRRVGQPPARFAHQQLEQANRLPFT
ncbi:AraC family transcriptional regulator [Thalassospira australica]|uniref:AraC family transcriptional regulator n=1 Tax=Thalassospira australica TaxID=1528106 RepID=UPI00051A5A82|nr:AraC family transcriptional regulator [Thalassospira australica]